MNLLRAEGLFKSYGEGERRVDILQGVDLSVDAGEMTAIIGASGSGKTTLLQILGTLDMPTDGGRLLFQGKELYKKSAQELASFRNSSLGFIFQFHHLLPDFTALENVLMPAMIGDRKGLESRAKGLLEQVELRHRLHHKVSELSGGEQQRTALARALVMSPTLLLADEPTGNLDQRSGEIVFTMLKRLCKQRGLATIMVTHNNELAAQMDRCLLLNNGRLQEAHF